MAVGRCWRTVTARVPGFSPMPEDRVILIGARSLDDAEERALRDSDIAWLTPTEVANGALVARTVEALAARVNHVHVHVDLDVFDPSVARANEYAAPGGPSIAQIHQVVTAVADRIPVSSATLASYDPTFDPAGRLRREAIELLAYLARRARPVSAHSDGCARQT